METLFSPLSFLCFHHNYMLLGQRRIQLTLADSVSVRDDGRGDDMSGASTSKI